MGAGRRRRTSRNPSFVQQLMTGPGPIMAMVVAVLYFLVFRPQTKKAQEQQKMLSRSSATTRS